MTTTTSPSFFLGLPHGLSLPCRMMASWDASRPAIYTVQAGHLKAQQQQLGCRVSCWVGEAP